jgi:MFS family permease
MAVTQVLGIIGRIVWGVMSDFVFTGKRVPTLQVASLTTVIGLVGLALTGKATPSWVILIAASLAGAGSIGFGGTAILLRAELAGRSLAATSTSIGMAIGAWGIVLGPPLFGFIVDLTNSYTLAWGLTAAASLAAVIMLRFIHEHKTGKKELGV